MKINSETAPPYSAEITDAHERMRKCFLAVFDYTLKDEDGLVFLRCWYKGDFQAIRKEWPDAPEEVFWADPCYKGKINMPVEPVGWQFYDNGEWWYGDDRIKDHRKNTEAAGYLVRDLYAAPQLPPDITKLVEALELISNTDPDNGTAWFHDIAHKALEAYHTEGINDVCF